MSGWRVIDLSSCSATLRVRRGQLEVQTEGDSRCIPSRDVAMLLVGHGVSLGPSVVQHCAVHDVTLLAVDWKGVPVSAQQVWATNTRVGARQLAQAQLSLPRRKNAWGQLVRAKVRGQAQVLEQVGSPAAGRLRELAGSVRSGDPTNVEATAARTYWRSLFGAGFIRDPAAEDARNGCLNYGYTILRGAAIRAVASAGLAPGLGVFHRGRSNAFNLADDLVEPYRPVVDWSVRNLPSGAAPDTPGVRKTLVDALLSQPFDDSGVTSVTSLVRLAQTFGQYVEGEVPRLSVASWPGPVGRDLDVPF